jgi:hypothetical protein
MIKSTTPIACKSKLWDALDILLNKSEQEMISFIAEFRDEFETLPILDIAFSLGMNGLNEYSEISETSNTLFGGESKIIAGHKTPIHVRGSIIYNEYLKTHKLLKKYPTIKEGEKLKFIYLKSNPLRSNVISFPSIVPTELNIEQYIDYDLQFEKSFLNPLKVLLDIVGWKTEETNSLEAFFK